MEQNMKEEKNNQYQMAPPNRRLKVSSENPISHHPPPPSQKCPRCDSSNTKFCYYNNYSLSQPRYFCKGCRRYWTQGGTLRNVPIGGGCRRGKRPKPISSSSVTKSTQSLPTLATQQNYNMDLVNSGQSIRPGSGSGLGLSSTSFYTGGPIMPSLAVMGGNGRANQFGVFQNDFNYPTQQNLVVQRPLGSWTQSFINRGAGAASSAVGSNCFWGGATHNGGDQVGSSSTSFNLNQWSSENHPQPHLGFNPSSS